MKKTDHIESKIPAEEMQAVFDQLEDDTLLPDTSELLVEKHMPLPLGYSTLVFEEDEMSRLLISYILYNNNISFEVAKTPNELKEKINNKKYGLVIAGVNGKEPDLSEVFKKNIPAVVVTASTGDNEIHHLLEVGYEYVLTEPYEEKQLIELIRKHMKKPSTLENMDAPASERAPSFSLEPLKKICKSDTAFMLKMLDKFIISINECTEGLQSGDVTKMKTAAHKSIPSYSIMGIEDVVTDLVFIEHHAMEETEHEKVNELAKKVAEHNSTLVQDTQYHIAQLKK